jgi:hypothetical protein
VLFCPCGLWDCVGRLVVWAAPPCCPVTTATPVAKNAGTRRNSSNSA